jgi:DNA-binding response OmpR family regulator
VAEVVLVRWPEEAADGLRLAEDGIAVLYLVDADADPPMPATCLEDWVRLPGDHRDLHARVAVLEARAAAQDAGTPTIDDHGRLHYRGRILALRGSEAKLTQALAASFGDVVTDRELSATLAIDPTDADGTTLRAQMARVRSSLRDIGLAVQRVRRRGYRLQRR